MDLSVEERWEQGYYSNNNEMIICLDTVEIKQKRENIKRRE